MSGLMDYLPEFYAGNTTMTELQNILTTQINNAAVSKDTTVNECFVNTASNLLSRYENLCGIEVNTTDSDAIRRERIVAKFIGTGTTTKQMIKDVASAFSNGEVEVIEDNANYRFTVKFVSQVGVPPGLDGLNVQIELIKPAHLQVVYELIYRTYRELKAYTYRQLSSYTYKQLREEAM